MENQINNSLQQWISNLHHTQSKEDTESQKNSNNNKNRQPLQLNIVRNG